MKGLLIVTGLAVLIALSANVGAEALFKGDEARPADAVVLFDGKGLSEWTLLDGKPADWRLENDYMEVRGGNIRTKREFTDCQLHVEFWLPSMPNASGQAKANSGVYLQGRYEVQVLDSYGLKSQSNDCGGIYGVSAPLVNACKPPEQWQTFDIFFHAPRFEGDKQISTARMSVLQNGVWIQDYVEIPGSTAAAMGDDVTKPGPIMLQDHGNPVRYRNVWVRDLTADLSSIASAQEDEHR